MSLVKILGVFLIGLGSSFFAAGVSFFLSYGQPITDLHIIPFYVWNAIFEDLILALIFLGFGGFLFEIYGRDIPEVQIPPPLTQEEIEHRRRQEGFE